MKNYLIFISILFTSTTYSQVYSNKRNFSKIDRLDSIEQYLESFSRQQQNRNRDLQKVSTQAQENNRNFSNMKRRLERLELENQNLRKELIKVKAQKTKVVKVDPAGNKVVTNDDPDRAVLLKELNELRLQLKLEKEDSDKKLSEFEATIKSMQAIILQNEKEKGKLRP